MSELASKVRTVEPFSFWPQYASALGNFGGSQGGPDPYYCFHTPYLEYAPGGLIFRMRLINARSTMGELALRVHAWKSDGSMDAVLVGGMRVPLEGLDGDHECAVRVASHPGIVYAFLARFTQPSDLQIDDLVLTAEELADEDVDTYSTMGIDESPFGTRNLNTPSHLTVVDEATLRAPLSQPFTARQLGTRDLVAWLPEPIQALKGDHDRWRNAYAWQAMLTYGMAEPGASGVIKAGPGSPLRSLLEQRGVLVSDQLPRKGLACHDFMIDMVGLGGPGDSVALGQEILSEMTSLRRHGLGIFIFDARIGGLARVDLAEPPEGRWIPTEQDIQRVALKVIGHGSEIAQLVWPANRVGGEPVPFGLLVRR